MTARHGEVRAARASGVYGCRVGVDGEVIALFPLSEVLLPAMPLPMQIFEPRYHQLLADVLGETGEVKDGAGFGVVALNRGSEAAPPSGEPDVAQVGTFAEILEVEPQPDGTVRLLAVGSRRFRIESLLFGLPYLRAEVSWLAEDDGDIAPGSVELIHRLCDQLSDAIGTLTGQRAVFTPLRDPTMLSYQVAAHVPLAPTDRQELLATPTTADRLRLAIQLLGREVRLVQSTRSIAMSPSVLRLGAEPN